MMPQHQYIGLILAQTIFKKLIINQTIISIFALITLRHHIFYRLMLYFLYGFRLNGLAA
jgi:hypothetical protein